MSVAQLGVSADVPGSSGVVLSVGSGSLVLLDGSPGSEVSLEPVAGSLLLLLLDGSAGVLLPPPAEVDELEDPVPVGAVGVGDGP